MTFATWLLSTLLIAQQQTGLSENFWIEALKSGPLLITAVATLCTAVVSSIVSNIQNWRLKKQQNTIRENTDGKLTEILAELEEALGRNIQLEKELQAAYAILSAREKRPVLRAVDVARAEDFGLPKRGNGGAQQQHRRHDDQVPPEERRQHEEHDQ